MISAETHHIKARTVILLMLLGPIIAVVYAAYTVGYILKRKGWWVMYPYGIAFAVLNVLHNWTVATILFWELPREWFTTQRLRRWKLSDDPSRRELAHLLGGLLNRHDIGHYRWRST